jgi:hypothetical protein
LNSVIQIVISGATLGINGDGLTFGETVSPSVAGTRTVRGIAFNSFARQIFTRPNDLANSQMQLVVEGCYFGTDAAGVALPTLAPDGSTGLDSNVAVRVGGLPPAQRNAKYLTSGRILERGCNRRRRQHQ